MNYGKLTAGTTKTAIDTAKPSEKGEIITYLSRMGDVLEQIFERNKVAQPFFRILVFGYCNVPHALLREYELQIVIHHDMFTPKTAEVFCNYTIDFPAFNVRHHAFEIWPFEVCSTPTVIDILVIDPKLIILCKFTQDRALRFNADAVAIAFVIAAEPHIKCRIVVWLIHNIYPPFAVKQPALVF